MYVRVKNILLWCSCYDDDYDYIHLNGCKVKFSPRTSIWRNQFNKLWGGWVEKKIVDRFYKRIPRKKKKLIKK